MEREVNVTKKESHQDFLFLCLGLLCNNLCVISVCHGSTHMFKDKTWPIHALHSVSFLWSKVHPFFPSSPLPPSSSSLLYIRFLPVSSLHTNTRLSFSFPVSHLSRKRKTDRPHWSASSWKRSISPAVCLLRLGKAHPFSQHRTSSYAYIYKRCCSLLLCVVRPTLGKRFWSLFVWKPSDGWRWWRGNGSRWC